MALHFFPPFVNAVNKDASLLQIASTFSLYVRISKTSANYVFGNGVFSCLTMLFGWNVYIPSAPG